jgi:hypothetical protein
MGIVWVILFILGGWLGGGSAPWAATDRVEWPCKEPFKRVVEPTELWETPPASSQNLLEPEIVEKAKELIREIASPQTSPAIAVRAINQFAQPEIPQKNALLYFIFRETVQEGNDHRKFILEGIGDFSRRATFLRELLTSAHNERAQLPEQMNEEQMKRGKELTTLIYWYDRQLDDAEDEQRLLCRRLKHLDYKLQQITQALQQHLIRE